MYSPSSNPKETDADSGAQHKLQTWGHVDRSCGRAGKPMARLATKPDWDMEKHTSTTLHCIHHRTEVLPLASYEIQVVGGRRDLRCGRTGSISDTTMPSIAGTGHNEGSDESVP